MPLNFFRLGRYTVPTLRPLEPSARTEDFGVSTPERSRTIHGFHRYRDESTFGDHQAVHDPPRFGADGLRERDDVVFDSLPVIAPSTA